MDFYASNQSSTPAYEVGFFPYPPYYWWESDAICGALELHGRHFFHREHIQALGAQGGPNQNFFVPQQTFDDRK
jgi:hypothetical protein